MRSDARRILLGAVHAVDAGMLVGEHLRVDGDHFEGRDVWLVAAGKAAASMSAAASAALGPLLVGIPLQAAPPTYPCYRPPVTPALDGEIADVGK